MCLCACLLGCSPLCHVHFSLDYPLPLYVFFRRPIFTSSKLSVCLSTSLSASLSSLSADIFLAAALHIANLCAPMYVRDVSALGGVHTLNLFGYAVLFCLPAYLLSIYCRLACSSSCLPPRFPVLPTCSSSCLRLCIRSGPVVSADVCLLTACLCVPCCLLPDYQPAYLSTCLLVYLSSSARCLIFPPGLPACIFTVCLFALCLCAYLSDDQSHVCLLAYPSECCFGHCLSL